MPRVTDELDQFAPRRFGLDVARKQGKGFVPNPNLKSSARSRGPKLKGAAYLECHILGQDCVLSRRWWSSLSGVAKQSRSYDATPVVNRSQLR